MKKKVIWLVVSGWMVAALLLTSCAPAVVEEEPAKVAPKEEVVPKKEVVPKEVVVPKKEAETVKWTGTKLDGTLVEKTIEKPQYGGIHITAGPRTIVVWDDLLAGHRADWQLDPVNRPLLMYDWTRGPGGTRDTSGQLSYMPFPNTFETGDMAESWELVKSETSDDLIYHIRQGVRWQDKPPLNGREFTAQDAMLSLRRDWDIGYGSTSLATLVDMENVENSIFVSPDDPWTLVVRNAPGLAARFFGFGSLSRTPIFAPELIYEDGEYRTVSDWREPVGTGPFMLTDYVVASSLTYKRNPNYWQHDPFFPENQLPYIDGFRYLIIPDKSTLLAALRTGRIDNHDGNTKLNREEAQSLQRTSPDLMSTKYLDTGGGRMCMNIEAKPFDDVRVRQALAMAVNNPEILELYHEGDGVLFAYPLQPFPENAAGYLPLERTSELVQEIYGYNPDKARKLLAAAGYPGGFKTNIIARREHVDLLSIVKEYWADIGVDLEIQVKDYATHRTIYRRKTQKQMIMLDGGAGPNHVWSSTDRKKGGSNCSKSPGDWQKVMMEQVIATAFTPAGSWKAIQEPLAEGMPGWIDYANEQVWSIYLPTPNLYVFWPPYLKGYYGAFVVSHSEDFGWTRYVWLDQELKKAMGY